MSEEKRFCRVCGVELCLSENIVPSRWKNHNNICRPCDNVQTKAYFQRPEVKQRRKAYSQRLEVKQRKKAYLQRPEVKARQHERWLALSPEEKAKSYTRWTELMKKHGKEWNRSPHIAIIDCFEKTVPKTFQELLLMSGAGKGYLRARLREYVAIGLVKQLGDETFCLNAESPLRMAADGYFKEAR